MLAGDDDIESVTFQKAGIEGVDDVVVCRSRELPMLCVQVKHKKISTLSADNLTFRALTVASSEENGSKKTLLASLAAGWKQISNEKGVNPEVVLYTNREMGPNRSDATYEGVPYKRLPLGEFWNHVSSRVESATSFADVVFPDSDLEIQWKEFADSTRLDENDIVPFLKNLTIEAGAPSLENKKTDLKRRLKNEVCAGHQELASRVFDLLLAELINWTTVAGKNVVTADIARKCLIKLNHNPLEEPIEVPVPIPVFPSRERACFSLCEKIKTSNRKVVFLRGCPGSGKTRLVSCLCERMHPRPIRLYAFRPLDVDDFSYSPDAGIVSPKDLWSTLLNQLRSMPELSGVKPQIPVINEICTDDDLRREVLRLAETLSSKRGHMTTIIIDGIDHAARANDQLTFLKHLPTPSSIPEGVRILVSGQPASLYSSYPKWLKENHDGVEVVDIPSLDTEDISTLLTEKTDFSPHEALVLANEVNSMAKGNTLSVVYAVHAISGEKDCGRALEILRSSGLSDNIDEYYESIWQKANDEIQRQHGSASNALDLIACSMHLLDGAIYPNLLSKAFPDAYSGDYVVKRDISILSPLMKVCADGSARPIHNDFRLFVSSKASQSGMEDYLRYASSMLADAALKMEGDVVRSCYAIRLLACSGRTDECIDLFDTSYVIDAIAHGVPWRLLREHAIRVYRMACESRNLERVFRVQLALATLSQVNEHFEYYLERRPFLHFEGLVGMDYIVPPFGAETADLYTAMLGRCLWLLKDAGCTEQSDELYSIWFSGISPLKAVEILTNRDGDGRRYQQEDASSMLMSAWGEYVAARGLDCSESIAVLGDTHDAEDLMSYFRDAYVKASLKWCQPEEDTAEKIAGIPITEDAAVNMMRDALTGALPASRAARCAFFSRLSSHAFERELGTIAYALCLSEGVSMPQVDRNRPLLCPREGAIYQNDFTLGLFAEAFVFGFESNCDEFEPLVLDMQEAVAWVDSSHREYLSFIRALRTSTCLGYSMGHDKAIRQGTGEAHIIAEWAKAPSLPGSMTIETCAIPYMLFATEKGKALCKEALEEADFESYVFSSRPLCVKLRMLEHLQNDGSNISKDYLKKEYGSDGSGLLASQDAVERHSLLRPLLFDVDDELALHCDNAILFGSARFTDHKDYSMSNLVEVFKTLSDLGMATEKQAFDLLEIDHAASWSGDNRMSDAVMEAVVDWAVNEGPSNLAKVRSTRPEYKYDYALIEYQLKALVASAESSSDLLSVFAGFLGHVPCCEPKDVDTLRIYLDICRKRADELGCGSDFADAVLDIENSIKDAPLYKSNLSYTETPPADNFQTLGDLTNDEVREAAFYRKVDRWRWEPVAEACSELEKRGFGKSDICNSLVMARGAALSKEGWVHFSSSLTRLINDIASCADDEPFFELLAYRAEELDRYGFGSASNDIAHAIMVRSKAKSPALFETMFTLEHDSKRKWISCNGKCALPAFENDEPDFPRPDSLPELVSDILLDSVVPHDPHRTEDAARGIVWGGLHLRSMRSRVCESLTNFDSYGRILLEKILGLWIRAFPEDEVITTCLTKITNELRRADEAGVLSAIIGAPKLIVRADVEDPKTIGSGRSKIPSCIKNFLSEIQIACKDECNDIKDAIEQCDEGETEPFVTRYMRNGETFLPIRQLDDYSQELVYAAICRGRWQGVPSYIVASMLIDPADAWVLSRLPVFKDPSTFQVSEAISLFEAGDPVGAGSLVEALPVFGLNDGEVCLGWKLYIPYGDQNEYECYSTARLTAQECKQPDNVIDREYGCYGLLVHGEGGKASCFSQNSISLCNALAGCITMAFCDCQIFPSISMRRLGFAPKADNPLIWIDYTGKPVAWFEQFSFPVERGHRPSAYYRQPRLWRWVCDEAIVESAAAKYGCRIYWALESSNHVDQIKSRHDKMEAVRKKSPFEKDAE